MYLSKTLRSKVVALGIMLLSMFSSTCFSQTILDAAYCNQDVPYGSVVSAIKVSGAVRYCFLVEDPSMGFSTEVQTTNQYLDLSSIAGLLIGCELEISVKVYYKGAWTAYGEPCTVTLTPKYVTQLKKSYCGSTITYPDAWEGYQMPGGFEYEFLIENTQINYSYHYFTTVWYVDPAYVPGLVPNLAYSVQVRWFDGNVWSDYGPACEITIEYDVTCSTDPCNLICNGDFESSPPVCGSVSGSMAPGTCPADLPNWCTTRGTPDWMHRNSCSQFFLVPQSVSGNSIESWSGPGTGNDAFASMAVWEVAEGMYAKLREPLVPLDEYTLSFYLRADAGSTTFPQGVPVRVSFHNSAPSGYTAGAQFSPTTWFPGTESTTATAHVAQMGVWTQFTFTFDAPCIQNLEYLIVEPEPFAVGSGYHLVVSADEFVLTRKLEVDTRVAFCENDPGSALSANLAGGFWSGDGIVEAIEGGFDPAVAGSGETQIQYLHVDDYGCVQRDEIEFSVHGGSAMSWPQTADASDDRGTGIAVDADGNVYCIGHFTDYGYPNTYPGDFGTGPHYSAGESDVFLIKYSKCGGIEWVVTPGGPNDDHGLDVIVDGDGGVYVSGYFGNDFQWGGEVLSVAGPSGQVFVAKVNPVDGLPIWIQGLEYTGAGFTDQGSEMALDPVSGDIFVGFDVSVGFSFAGEPFVPETQSTTGICIARFDQNGNQIWFDTYDTDGLAGTRGVAVDKQGNAYLYGHVAQTANLIIPAFGTTPAQQAENAMFVGKYDSVGDRQYAFVNQSVAGNVAGDIATDDWGNVYFTATWFYYHTLVVEGSAVPATHPVLNGVLVSYDQQGNFRFAQNVGGMNAQGLETWKDKVFVYGDYSDFHFQEWSCEGQLKWQISSGPTTPDEFDNHIFDCSVDLNGHPRIIGRVNNQCTFGPHVLVSTTGTDDYFAHEIQIDDITGEGYFKAYGPSVQPSSALDSAASILIYPNPASDVVTVELQSGLAATSIALLDLQGRDIALPPVEGAASMYRIDVSGLQSGIYFLRVNDGRDIHTQKIVLVE